MCILDNLLFIARSVSAVDLCKMMGEGILSSLVFQVKKQMV